MKCNFKLDRVHITLVGRGRRLLEGLSKYMRINRSVREDKTKNPLMADKFRKRTYLTFGGLRKMYLIHKKRVHMAGIDALLVLHDVSFVELQRIGWVLQNLPSVKDFHFSLIEFAWDFYPSPRETAVHLQKRVIKALHLKNARIAWRSESSLPRVTYYINDGQSDLFAKIYIRPLEPDPTIEEFVRVELTGRTRWLQGQGIQRPKDFLRIQYTNLTKQVLWLDLDMRRLRRSPLNVLTGGHWLERIKVDHEHLGISYVITERRQDKLCPARCRRKGNLKKCQLIRSHGRGEIRSQLVEAIKSCSRAREQTLFERTFTRPSKMRKTMSKKLEDAYMDWLGPPPLFSSGFMVQKQRQKSQKVKKRGFASKPLKAYRLF